MFLAHSTYYASINHVKNNAIAEFTTPSRTPPYSSQRLRSIANPPTWGQPGNNHHSPCGINWDPRVMPFVHLPRGSFQVSFYPARFYFGSTFDDRTIRKAFIRRKWCVHMKSAPCSKCLYLLTLHICGSTHIFWMWT
jgi:hypothetical protein